MGRRGRLMGCSRKKSLGNAAAVMVVVVVVVRREFVGGLIFDDTSCPFHHGGICMGRRVFRRCASEKSSGLHLNEKRGA